MPAGRERRPLRKHGLRPDALSIGSFKSNAKSSRRFPSALLPTGPPGEWGAARAAADETERSRFAAAEGSERGTEPRLPVAPPRCHFPPSGLRPGPPPRRSKRSERRAARDEPRGAAARLEDSAVPPGGAESSGQSRTAAAAAASHRTELSAAAPRGSEHRGGRSHAPPPGPPRELRSAAPGPRRHRERRHLPGGSSADGPAAARPSAIGSFKGAAAPVRPVPSRPASPPRPPPAAPLRSAPPSPLGAAPPPLCRRRRARLSARPLGGRRGSGGARRRAAGAGRGAPSSRASRGH